MVELRTALGGAVEFDRDSVTKAIDRLKTICWEIARRVRSGTATEDDVTVGLACATNLSLMLAYYDVKAYTGMDETNLFLARETAGATARLCIDYVKYHKK